MANPRQKRKRISSRPLVRQKPKSKRLAIKTNPIIAQNWDRKATLSQNYQRLGLTARLNGATGGTERKIDDIERDESDGRVGKGRGFAVQPSAAEKAVGSVKVIRDEDGKIVQVVREAQKEKFAGDLLDDTSDEEEAPATRDTEVVRQLEEHSQMVPRKKRRKMAKGEGEWVERLIGRWGDDFEVMSRDKNLNPMLHSPAVLRKKVRAWREQPGSPGGQDLDLG